MASSRDINYSNSTSRYNYRRNYRRGYDSNRRTYNNNRKLETVGNIYEIPKKVFNVPPPVNISAKPRTTQESLPHYSSNNINDRKPDIEIVMAPEIKCAWAIRNIEHEISNTIDFDDFPSLGSDSVPKKNSSHASSRNTVSKGLITSDVKMQISEQSSLTQSSAHATVLGDNIEIPAPLNEDINDVQTNTMSSKIRIQNRNSQIPFQESIIMPQPGSITILKRERNKETLDIHINNQISSKQYMSTQPMNPVVLVKDTSNTKGKEKKREAYRKDCTITTDGSIRVSKVSLNSTHPSSHRIIHNSAHITTVNKKSPVRIYQVNKSKNTYIPKADEFENNNPIREEIKSVTINKSKPTIKISVSNIKATMNSRDQASTVISFYLMFKDLVMENNSTHPPTQTKARILVRDMHLDKRVT
ncbi:hypothetical protein HZS_3091 [Henneguya salminicola]|nr:hypothetical protein HZS_3091 [Henneguya salminicola]